VAFKVKIMSKIISNILIFSYLMIFSLFFSFAHAEDTLGDSVENLKTCGEGKTYDEDSDSCGGPCAVNDSGAIIIASNGLPYDAGNSAAYRDSCNMIPDLYRVTLYKGGLCTSDPYSASGTSVDYTSNCDLFFSDDNGKAITLTNQGDGTATASPSLVEDGVNLGIKTYTHAFMVMSNHLQIKHDQVYDFSATTTATAMRGGGDAITTGTTCWTIDRTSTFSNLDGTTGANHGSVALRTGDGSAAEASTKCGSAVDGTFDYATEIIETFGEANGNWNASAVTSRWPYAASSLGGGNKAAILIQSDLETVATTMENGVALLYAVDLTNPLVITEDTTQFNIGFGLSGSVSVDFTTQDGADFLFITKHGADPVDILFTAN
tara:strand:- start:235 stop:1368 length:1134 start_codon:yes stop_codon:yes gene_type:complete